MVTPPANRRDIVLRLRWILGIGLLLIVASLLYNRYDATRPVLTRRAVEASAPSTSAAPSQQPAPVSPAGRPDLSQPIAELRAKLQQNPKDVTVRTRLASLLDMQGNGSDAEDVIREALQQGQRHPDLYHALGVLYVNNGLYRPAVAAFAQEIRLRPKHAPAYVQLGSAYAYGGNPREAERAYLKAQRLDPSYPDTYLGLAFLNNTSDRYPYAVKYINEYIRRSKYPGPGYALLCRVYINMNLHDRAIEAGKKAIRLVPDNPNVWYTLGQALFYKPGGAHLEQAASAFVEAIRRKPDFGHAHFELASVLARMGRWKAAIAEYREAIRYEPWQGRYHYQLGRALIQAGQKEEGQQRVAQAQQLIRLNQMEARLLDKITVSPQDPQLRYELAQVYQQLGRYDVARLWYNATLDVAPDHPGARQALNALPR
ncbi:MAG: tetratricopeptide repeat protein [Chloroherpetonaceae bacterium]|nr:tetratricopeptide repeat protein [Chloroherpetonaceae bacterium]